MKCVLHEPKLDCLSGDLREDDTHSNTNFIINLRKSRDKRLRLGQFSICHIVSFLVIRRGCYEKREGKCSLLWPVDESGRLVDFCSSRNHGDFPGHYDF